MLRGWYSVLGHCLYNQNGTSSSASRREIIYGYRNIPIHPDGTTTSTKTSSSSFCNAPVIVPKHNASPPCPLQDSQATGGKIAPRYQVGGIHNHAQCPKCWTQLHFENCTPMLPFEHTCAFRTQRHHPHRYHQVTESSYDKGGQNNLVHQTVTWLAKPHAPIPFLHITVLLPDAGAPYSGVCQYRSPILHIRNRPV